MNVVRRCKHGIVSYNRKDQWQGKSFEIYGESMESEIDFLISIAQQGMTIVDVGAGIGSHSLPLSRAVGCNGRVLAYEPERHNFYSLCANVCLNDLANIYPHQYVISNKNGIIRVPEIDENITTNFGGLKLYQDYSGSLTYPVAMTKIDDLKLRACDIIKVDVEGMEVEVIEGSQKTIEQFHPYLYIENDKRDQKNLQNILFNLGYDIYLHKAPLFNLSNFYGDRDNIFINSDNMEYVSEMLYCIHCERKSTIDPISLRLKQLS